MQPSVNRSVSYRLDSGLGSHWLRELSKKWTKFTYNYNGSYLNIKYKILNCIIMIQDGMVRFDTSTENSSSPEMLSLLEDGVTAAIRLDKQVSESWCNIYH